MTVIRSRKTVLTEIIYEVLNFFEAHYPEEYQRMVDDMAALRAASAPTYKARGENVYVSFKVPTVLYLGIRYITECRRIQPAFGDSADDIALLTSIAKAFNGGARTVPGTRFVLPKGFYEKVYGKKEDQTHAATGSDEPQKVDRCST